MGIIEKQATKNAIYSYLGAGLGFVTIMWISHLLTPAENGAIKLIVSYALLFSQFANLGFTSITSRFFPFFRNHDKGHHGFLFYALMVTLIGFLLCWFIFLFIKPGIIERNVVKSPLFTDYLFYLIPLTFFIVYFNIFDSYLRACYSSVIGSFAKDFLQRVLILVVLFLYSSNYITIDWFVFLYFFMTALPSIVLLCYIVQQKQWHVKPVKGFISKELRNEMIQLGVYSILAGGAGAIILNIDVIMVNELLDEKQSGIYGIAFYFGAIILIPARSIYRITSSIVAENFKQNKIADIHTLYKQSCNTQLTIGLLLFIGICVNIDNIMMILPTEYSAGKAVILILATGYLFEMAMGINQVIISNSPYFKFDTYFVLILVVLTILTNYIFIPIYGIKGSAIATAITIVFGNTLRFVLLYKKYTMQPYTINSVKIIIVGIISFIVGYVIPETSVLILNIFIKSFATAIVFFILMLKSEMAPEINIKIRKNLKRFSINI